MANDGDDDQPDMPDDVHPNESNGRRFFSGEEQSAEEEDAEEMERMMMAQQAADEEVEADGGVPAGPVDHGVLQPEGEFDGAAEFGEDAIDRRMIEAGDFAGERGGGDLAAAADPLPLPAPPRRSYVKLHYTKLSLLAAVSLILYALRTRGQAYLALTYLTSSKLSYIVLGNAVIAASVSLFHSLTRMFLGGLRQVETEAIGESMRWNLTETCIALTIFRSEVDVAMGGMFLTLVVGKCLHWAAELRGSNLRMTEEAFYFLDGEDAEDGGPAASSGGARGGAKPVTGYFWRLGDALVPKTVMSALRTAYLRTPRLRRSHLKFLALVELLLLCDVAAVSHCAFAVAEHGPSVHILFGFEAAILGVTALSVLASYELHVMDGLVTVLHHLLDPSYHAGMGLYHGPEDIPAGDAADEAERAEAPPPPPTPARRLLDRVSASWRDRRATLSFFIELVAQALKFLFYLLFFAIVFTYYGMPINIFREVYVSYQQLRRRLSAFANYRRLTSNMNERFESVTDDAELDEAGRTCIICRDRMDSGGGCKKLPGCGHVFHRHCLREWLVQQQSCPTCRADIAENEAKERAEKRRRERAAEDAARAEERLREAAPQESPPPTVPGTEPKGEPTSEAVARGPPSAASALERALPRSVPPLAPPDESDPTQRFPALYRSKFPHGSKVYIRKDSPSTLGNGGSGTSAGPVTCVLRTVPPGKIILCTEKTWWEMDTVLGGLLSASEKMTEKEGEETQGMKGEEEEEEEERPTVGGVMLQMPDGYVSESEVDRAAVLCVPKGVVWGPPTAEMTAKDKENILRETDSMKMEGRSLREANAARQAAAMIAGGD